MLIRTKSVEQTKSVAASLEPLLTGGDVLLLSGDLGAGKTAFVQGLAAALGITESVTSPTFTLAAVYRQGRLPLHHLDAYRLENLSEARDLDLPELLDDNAVLAIEWGEVLMPELPRDYLEIHLRLDARSGADSSSHADSNSHADSRRVIEFKFVGPTWQKRSQAVVAAVAVPTAVDPATCGS